MPLFNYGPTKKLHSGQLSDTFIDADALSNEDIINLARFIASKTKFSNVYGVPTGGIKLANELYNYITPVLAPRTILLVDDVVTTGNSIKQYERILRSRPNIGDDTFIYWAIFSRNKEIDWVNSVFQVNL